MHAKKLMRDTAFLTASSLAMRCIALIFQMWLVGRIGAAGVGLYGLVSSVDFLAATFAISGVRFAATRLIAEEIGLGREGGVGGAMGRCILYSLLFGSAACAILYLCAEPIGFLWIGDARTVLSLKILSFSLPFMSLSSVMYGYFAASGRIFKSAAVQVAEQIIRIALVVCFLKYTSANDLERSCASVAAGGTLAEICSFLIMLVAFVIDRGKHRAEPKPSPRLTGRMLNIALPLALSAYARTCAAVSSGTISSASAVMTHEGKKITGNTIP